MLTTKISVYKYTVNFNIYRVLYIQISYATRLKQQKKYKSRSLSKLDSDSISQPLGQPGRVPLICTYIYLNDQ